MNSGTKSNLKFSLKLALTVIASTWLLAGCGGGSDAAGNSQSTGGGGGTATSARLVVSPSLGKFVDGTVTVRRADGSTAATAAIANGSAVVNADIGCAPAIVEVANGHYYDEGADQVAATGSMVLHAATSCFANQRSIGVTALTEFAFQELGSARDAAAIDRVNADIGARYAPELRSILDQPTLVGSRTDARALGAGDSAADLHALRLAGYALLAAKGGKSTLALIQDAGRNIAATGSIDGADAQSFNRASFQQDYLAALQAYTASTATGMASAFHVLQAATDVPAVMKTQDFAQLMRLFEAVPHTMPTIAVAPYDPSGAGVQPYYNLGCNPYVPRDPTSGSENLQAACPFQTIVAFSPCYDVSYRDVASCNRAQGIGIGYLPDVSATGSVQTTYIPDYQGYRYAQHVKYDLMLAANLSQLRVTLEGDDMNAFTGDFGGTPPPVWAAGVPECSYFNIRNATVTLGAGAGALTLTGFDACAFDSRLASAPNSPTLDLMYAVRGTGAAGRSFSNADTPLVFRRAGILVDQSNHPSPLLVQGKLSYPTAADRTITIEPADASGANALITLTVGTAPDQTVERTVVPVDRLLRKAIY